MKIFRRSVKCDDRALKRFVHYCHRIEFRDLSIYHRCRPICGIQRWRFDRLILGDIWWGRQCYLNILRSRRWSTGHDFDDHRRQHDADDNRTVQPDGKGHRTGVGAGFLTDIAHDCSSSSAKAYRRFHRAISKPERPSGVTAQGRSSQFQLN